MTRLRKFALAVTLAVATPLGATQVAGAYGRPVTEPAPVVVTTIAVQADDSLLVVGTDVAGRWELAGRGVTVTRNLDGSTGIGWPCPPATLVGASSATVSANSFVQGGDGYSFEFTSPGGTHQVRPDGPCGARVVVR